MIKETLTKQHGKSELGPKHYEQVKNIEEKIIRLQDLYVEGNIEKSEYKIAKERYTKIHEELKSKEGDLKDKKSVIEIYENALKKIETIENQYYESDIEGKRKIILLFPHLSFKPFPIGFVFLFLYLKFRICTERIRVVSFG
jgi:hypothetical protein